jgi:hypothetical protein
MSNTATTAAQTQRNFRSTIATCSQTKSEKVDWGIQFIVSTEIEALRIAYSFRNAPHGVQVRFADHRDIYMVTVFNERASQIGIDRS